MIKYSIIFNKRTRCYEILDHKIIGRRSQAPSIRLIPEIEMSKLIEYFVEDENVFKDDKS